MSTSTVPDDVTTGAPLLQVRDLEVAFLQYERGLRRRVVTALHGMDLDASTGELVALVGASGAGKSLLAHAVLGLLPPNAVEHGTVLYDGAEVSPAERRRLAGRETALLPQSVSFLDQTSTVGRQLRRSAQLAGLPDPRAAAVESVERRGLSADVLKRYPHELSGGMTRRVLVAMATMGSPRLVVADEPTTGLPPELVSSVLAEFRATADAGAAVVVVTHELRAALDVADRVVIVRDGRTVDAVTPDLFSGDGERLEHPYTRALWQALPENGFRVPVEV